MSSTNVKQEVVLDAIRAERTRQDRTWGGATHDHLHSLRDWNAFVTKYMGRAMDHDEEGEPNETYLALVQAAALIVAALETSEIFSQNAL